MAALEITSWRRRLLPITRTIDIPLLIALLCLMAMGLLAMYSSGYDHGTRFFDHLRNMVLSLIVLLAIAQIPPQRLMSLAVPLYTFGVALLIAVAVFGITKKGARRWLNVGVVIQPSEILKIAMPLMIAWWFQHRESNLRLIDWLIAGVFLAIPALLIMRQPDLGTALLVLSSGFAVIFFSGIRWWIIAPPIVALLVAVGLLILYQPHLCADGVSWPLLHDYQQQRICTLLDPMRDPLGSGFHVLQSRIAIGSGGFFGAGLLQGTQTHLEFIPERTTDFIFAAFSEEFGFLGNLALISAYLFLILRGLVIAMNAPTLFSQLLAGSLAMIFFTYTFVNIGMVSGLLPVVGVPLPFVSYGGTAMVTLGSALGMLMSISNSRHLIQS
jgi:rod shape determining protein RodA